jgi:malonate decarboxylase gamma subunit
MVLADILHSLFPHRADWSVLNGLVDGAGMLPDGSTIHVLGTVNGTELGIESAAAIAKRVLEIARLRDKTPLLMLVDSGAQRMRKRDELMGMNEYLAHLFKATAAAHRAGHTTIALLFGTSAAGAFIATGLSSSLLVALPGASPMVMELRAMSRITKLSVEVLELKAQSTAVFAPGLSNMIKLGAIDAVWDPNLPLAPQLVAALERAQKEADERDRIGEARGGRTKAASIAARMVQLVSSKS